MCANSDIWCLPFAAYSKPGTGIVIDTGPGFSKRSAAIEQLLRQREPREVPFIALPRLARFLDMNNPGSLAPVPPGDLAASFGPSVKLERVILQLTDDPVTPLPENWPQWLKEKGRMVGKLRGYQND